MRGAARTEAATAGSVAGTLKGERHVNGKFHRSHDKEDTWERQMGIVLVDSAGPGSEEICERGCRMALSTHQCP